MNITRRKFLQKIGTAGAAAALPRLASATAKLPSRPNVLFLGVDDLNDFVGCLGGHPQVKTPNLDRLAGRGTLFANAHCQAPLCNPSRNSLLTGLRPSTTGIYGLKPGIREVPRTRKQVTLPQTFTAAGYFSFTCGKIYHDGTIKPSDQPTEFERWVRVPPETPRPPKMIASLPEPRHPLMDWGPYPANDAETTDYQAASATVQALQAAPTDRPFFISCGFRLPHVPCYAPQKWFDLYPDETLVMPPVREGERDDTPRFSWYLHWRLPEPRLRTLQERHEWRPLVRAYLASVSCMDAQVGRVLDALDATGRADNTIIVFWSDHGWHLGEKAISGKNTLWKRSTHVPLIFAGPGVGSGAKCHRPVESLDIFPTLLELAGLPPRPDLEGHSLVPLCRDPNAAREWPAITTHNENNHAVLTEKWRYIRYADGSEELYDVQADPHEWHNLANRGDLAEVKRTVARWLPGTNLPPAPGSEQRILTYDPATRIATWEGKIIGPQDPIPEGM